MIVDYCAACAPSPCFQEECAPARCDGCGARLDMDTAWTCWSCNTDTCPSCVDSNGFSCSHFASDR